MSSPVAQVLGRLLGLSGRFTGKLTNLRKHQQCVVGARSRFSASSRDLTSIENHVLISHGVNIHDKNSHSHSHSHSHSAAARRQHVEAIFFRQHFKGLRDVNDAAVLIEDGASINSNATVLKGVTTGRGTIIGASSMVTKDVAPFTVVAGSPARVVGIARP